MMAIVEEEEKQAPIKERENSSFGSR